MPENPDAGKLDLHENESSPLAFVVGFFFAFRAFIMVLSVRMLGTDPQTGTAISLAAGGLLLLLVAFSTVGQNTRSLRQIAGTASVRCALLYLAFSCLSLLWSETSSLSIAIVYWCGMAADFAAIALMLRARTVSRIAPSLMEGFIWGACLGAIVAWLLPAQSDLRLGDEELLGPNNIAYPLAIAFLFAQYLMRNRLGKFAPHAAFLGLTVLRSLSKTTILALLAAQALLLIADRSMKRRTKLYLLLCATLAFVAFSALLISYWEIYLNSGNQSETLSGRLGIWAYFLVEGAQKPWFGHGFNSVWGIVPTFGPDKFEAAHAHNELIQQFYAYGAIGACLFAGYYWSLFRQARKLASSPIRVFLFAFLLFFLIRGFADTERFDLSLPMWAGLLVSELIEYHRSAQQQAAEAVSPQPWSLAPEIEGNPGFI
jgi:exopolysaccharide production protein ExoQ